MTQRPSQGYTGSALVRCGLTAVFVLGACQTTSTGPGGPSEITQLPRSLTTDELEVIASSNAFGFELFGKLFQDEPTENLFISPLSAHMALGMALNGAQDSTFSAMRAVLGFGSGVGSDPAPELDAINAAYSDLLALLDGLDPAVQLDLGNSLWYRPTFPFRPAYLDRVSGAFDAEVQGLDFDDPASVDVINGWVEGATNGRIERMLDRIDASEVMFLLNAIYFNGDWRVPFDAALTHDAPFALEDGSSKTVKMMVREGPDLQTAHHATLELVDLPYGGGPYRMTVVLPAPGVSLANTVDRVDVETWDSWISSLSSSGAPVKMPRFRLEWEKQLRDVLEAMGMEIAFQPGQANFGGMLDEAFDPQAAGTDLYITRVKQKSFVDVNEKGTEAAAATSVGVGVTSAPVPVTIDRPFLFAIREQLSGTILFLGAILDPPSS